MSQHFLEICVEEQCANAIEKINNIKTRANALSIAYAYRDRVIAGRILTVEEVWSDGTVPIKPRGMHERTFQQIQGTLAYHEAIRKQGATYARKDRPDQYRAHCRNRAQLGARLSRRNAQPRLQGARMLRIANDYEQY